MNSNLKKIIEAAIFVSEEPISEEDLVKNLAVDRDDVSRIISELEKEYSERGIRIEKVAEGYRFSTDPEIAEYVQQFIKDRPVKLSKHLMETLSIIAYKQPITRKEILSIRGKNPDGAIKSLLEKGLIKVIGRGKSPGRPKLYGTTKSFLMHFGLESIKKLPPLEE